MIQLPDSVTTAVLALVLGAVLGGAACCLWVGQKESADPTGRPTTIFEPGRFLKPDDTTGQREPDVEIRYRTRPETTRVRDTLRDTLRVPVPSELQTGVISSRTPIKVTSDRAMWTYWDPSDRRYEQREWRVPVDRYQASVYAVGLRRWQPRPTLQAGLGVEATLNFGWLPGTIEPFGEVRAGRQVVATTGLRWHFSVP